MKPKIDIEKMDMGSVEAFIGNNAESLGLPVPKDGSGKKELHDGYMKTIKEMKKRGVVLGGECTNCNADAPADENGCPYCGEEFDDSEEKPVNRGLTVSAGDKLTSLLSHDDYVNRITARRKDAAGNIHELGTLLKAARDTEVYKDHGTWAEFCERCGFSVSTAGNFIRVVEAYPKASDIPELPFGQVYQIASVPEEHREEVTRIAASHDRADLNRVVEKIRSKKHPQQSKAGKAKAKEPDEIIIRKGTKVEAEPETPRTSLKIGQLIKAKWKGEDGKLLQTVDAMKKGGFAVIPVGESVRLVIRVTNDGPTVEVVAGGK